jgi:hypothetical protein
MNHTHKLKANSRWNKPSQKILMVVHNFSFLIFNFSFLIPVSHPLALIFPE